MQSPFQNKISIPDQCQVIFVADLFAEDYVGGAELTTQALIDSSHYNVFKLHSKDVDVELLKQGKEKFWIFGNFANLDPNLIPTIIGNINYSVLEYDYKYCKFRSPEKHTDNLKMPCDCHNQINGKIISAFYYGAKIIFWMSEKQLDRYVTLFPFLAEKDNIVLSSVFSNETLGKIKALRLTHEKSPKNGWIVLGSNSWIKGANAALEWCVNKKIEPTVIWNQPYDDVLEKLATAEGFVYLPLGGDTCPRMTIEAKLLGCKLVLNEHVQHASESWFQSSIDSIEEYLFSAKTLFWNSIRTVMEYKPTISGYCTSYNCVERSYPIVECIESMLQFCDEVCVVDSGSTDETLEVLTAIAYPGLQDCSVIHDWIKCHELQEFPDKLNGKTKHDKIRIKVIPCDMNDPNFAIKSDGMQKANARDMCTKEFCWQMDSDEIVHEDDAEKIINLCKILPKGVDILSLPVIEYWGSQEKVRIDINPAKWRLSRNNPDITHGIPKELRRYDENGNLYAAEGTDSCDMISKKTLERLHHATFLNENSEKIRKIALFGDPIALSEYEKWFNNIVSELPSVHHYSWFDLERKIKMYKDYWGKFWQSMYKKSTDDTAENNVMFDVPWKDVTDEMIKDLANELREKTGGHIWHRKWDHKTVTPHIKVAKSQPKLMRK